MRDGAPLIGSCIYCLDSVVVEYVFAVNTTQLVAFVIIAKKAITAIQLNIKQIVECAEV